MDLRSSLDLRAYILKFRISRILDFQIKNEHELKLNEVLKKSKKKIKSNERVTENQQKEVCNTRTSRRSPILVLLSPKHA